MSAQIPASGVKKRACAGLWKAFEQQKPGVAINAQHYVNDFRNNLLPNVSPGDFKADLLATSRAEFKKDFCAIHSSLAMMVNCFAPFRHQIADLTLPTVDPTNAKFNGLCFRRKCPTGLRGTPPRPDVFLLGTAGVVAIDSTLTEHLEFRTAEFSESYTDQSPGKHWENGKWFDEMLRLIRYPKHYKWLNAAQLIKHAFGLAQEFSGESITLLYLYWEPENPDCNPAFAEHRQEVEGFARRVAGSKNPVFKAMSYRELWNLWRAGAPDWLREHLDQLKKRYLISI